MVFWLIWGARVSNIWPRVGKHFESFTPSKCLAAFPVQLKTTLVCWLRNADETFSILRRITRTPYSSVSLLSRYWMCEGALTVIVVNLTPKATPSGNSCVGISLNCAKFKNMLTHWIPEGLEVIWNFKLTSLRYLAIESIFAAEGASSQYSIEDVSFTYAFRPSLAARSRRCAYPSLSQRKAFSSLADIAEKLAPALS